MTMPKYSPALSAACAVLLLAWGSTQSASATPLYDSSYTSIVAAGCKTIQFDEESASSTQQCESFWQIGVLVLEGDLRQSITLVRDGQEYPLEFWSTVTSAFSELGDKIEWRHIKRRPDRLAGMIVRLNAAENPEQPEQTTAYLVVSKVTPQQVCVVGKIPPQADGSQNVQARVMAEQAERMACLQPE